MRDPGCSWVHAKFRTLRCQRFFPPTNTLPCLTIFSLPPFTMVLSWQATFNSIKMVFQFSSMSLNFLLNRRGLPGTTTLFPQCNLKSLTIQIVVLVLWLLFVLIYLQIILEESALARGNRPTLFFLFILQHLGVANSWHGETVPILHIPGAPCVQTRLQNAVYISEQQAQIAQIVDMVKDNNQVSQTPTTPSVSK